MFVFSDSPRRPGRAAPPGWASVGVCWGRALASAAAPPRPSEQTGWSGAWAAPPTDPAARSSDTAGPEKVQYLLIFSLYFYSLERCRNAFHIISDR